MVAVDADGKPAAVPPHPLRTAVVKGTLRSRAQTPTCPARSASRTAALNLVAVSPAGGVTYHVGPTHRCSDSTGNRHRADGALDGVEQRQARETRASSAGSRGPSTCPRTGCRWDSGTSPQPESSGQPVPHLGLLVVSDAVPVDGENTVDQLHAIAHGICHGIPSHQEFQVSLATDRPIADKTGSELVF